MATTFLLEFSRQNVPPEQLVRNFSDRCAGKRAEVEEIHTAQTYFDIQGVQLGQPDVHVGVGEVCQNTASGARTGDACVYIQATWEIFDKDLRRTVTSAGVDQMSAVHDGSRWWLCNHDFYGQELFHAPTR